MKERFNRHQKYPTEGELPSLDLRQMAELGDFWLSNGKYWDHQKGVSLAHSNTEVHSVYIPIRRQLIVVGLRQGTGARCDMMRNWVRCVISCHTYEQVISTADCEFSPVVVLSEDVHYDVIGIDAEAYAKKLSNHGNTVSVLSLF